MNTSYRRVAFAAGGVAVVAVAARLLRRRVPGLAPRIAQAMTVSLDRGRVLDALVDGEVIARALGSDRGVSVQMGEDHFTIEWSHAEHPHRNGRLALIPAPTNRGTELHIVMRGAKYDVKDVVRKIKALVETGEIPTGERF